MGSEMKLRSHSMNNNEIFHIKCKSSSVSMSEFVRDLLPTPRHSLTKFTMATLNIQADVPMAFDFSALGSHNSL